MKPTDNHSVTMAMPMVRRQNHKTDVGENGQRSLRRSIQEAKSLLALLDHTLAAHGLRPRAHKNPVLPVTDHYGKRGG
jgi:hypothetical protein